MTARRIIDAHCHIGRTVTNGIGRDVETWLAAMDGAGIDRAIISVAAGGIQAEGLADTRRANDVIAEAVRQSPSRALPAGASPASRSVTAGPASARYAALSTSG